MFKTILTKVAPAALFAVVAVACLLVGSPLLCVIAAVAAVGSFVIA